MKKSLARAHLACLCAGLTLLTGCSLLPNQTKTDAKATHATATPPKSTSKATSKASDPSQAAPAPAAKQNPLNDGVELYNAGDFNGAIKRLAGAPEIWSGDKATQVTALKYMAFSYCVTRRKTLCKQQFNKALKLDPAFDLAQGEKGHPLWGPVFDQAKKRK
jgi:hypothetical protein